MEEYSFQKCFQDLKFEISYFYYKYVNGSFSFSPG